MCDKLQIAEAAARAAGAAILRHTGCRVECKDESHNLVTAADLAAESAAVGVIRATFPDHAFFCEEKHRDRLDAPALWVIDPLDGTTNFAHGFPMFCTSIAYFENGRAEVGVVFNPVSGELFSARRGGGAFLQGVPIRASEVPAMNGALVCTGFYYDRDLLLRRTMDAVLALFAGGIHGIRRTGSAALDLCFVACGRLDAYFEFRLMPWDFAAGALIVSESGGRAGTCAGAELPLACSGVAAANRHLFGALVDTVKPFDPDAQGVQK